MLSVSFQDQRTAPANLLEFNEDAFYAIASTVGMNMLDDVDIRVRVREAAEGKSHYIAGVVDPESKEEGEELKLLPDTFRIVVRVPDAQPAETNLSLCTEALAHYLRHLAVLRFCPTIIEVGFSEKLVAALELDAMTSTEAIKGCDPAFSIATNVEPK